MSGVDQEGMTERGRDMPRITNKQLEGMVDHLNKVTGNEVRPYTRDDNGKYKANIGNYHLSGAYGGVALHQMLTPGGGIRDVFKSGHGPKRDLYNRITSFIDGISFERGEGLKNL